MDSAALSTEELLLKCANRGDEASWEEFVRRFHRLIATVALRVARRWGEFSPQVIDDLVQEVYLKLCADRFRMLRSFKSHHPDAFYGYLKVVTANLVLDHFKGAHSIKRGSGRVGVAADAQTSGTPDATGAVGVADRIERKILMREVDALINRLDAGPHLERDRTVFWLYYRVGLTANAIAALPSIGLSMKGVESTILRLTRLLRQEISGGLSRLSAGSSGAKGI
jgi:RNA polymerase sigma-70 factor, ECF subfamily